MCVVRREDLSLSLLFLFLSPFCFIVGSNSVVTQTALMMKKRKGKLLIPGDIGFVTSKLVRWNYGNNFYLNLVSTCV